MRPKDFDAHPLHRANGVVANVQIQNTKANPDTVPNRFTGAGKFGSVPNDRVADYVQTDSIPSPVNTPNEIRHPVIQDTDVLVRSTSFSSRLEHPVIDGFELAINNGKIAVVPGSFRNDSMLPSSCRSVALNRDPLNRDPGSIREDDPSRRSGRRGHDQF